MSFRESAQGDRGKTVGDARALTAPNHQLMAEGDDSKAPFQMIANLDLQTLHIGLKAHLDVAKLNLMPSSDCSQIGTGSSNSPRSANESVRTDTGSGVISWAQRKPGYRKGPRAHA